MRVGIIGHGVVGSSMHALFPDARICDPAKGLFAKLDACDIVFVCVPTPESSDGSADTSIVRAAVTAHKPGLYVIRSTVPPGTTRSLNRPAVFQPEYLGMTPGHAFASDRDVPFVILGGARQDTEAVADLYRTVLPPETAYHHTTPETAELVKYATNTFLATKVEFTNELYDAAFHLGLDFEALRELWLLDQRIGRSHTGINRKSRGFGGACFPKDMSAFIAWAEANDVDVPVIRSARDKNRSARL